MENTAEVQAMRTRCEVHEQLLKELVRGRYAFLRNYLSSGLLFGIARRWNSWYPSYFDVEGGCYILVPGDMDPRSDDNRKDSRVGAVVIDPGFRFLDIVREHYMVEPQDIRSVVVTHFHPDHMAGLIEYCTIMTTSKQPCNIYLNETSFSSFKALQNAFITVNELCDGQIQEVMRYATRDGKHVSVTVEAVSVHHDEIGNQHRSLGLVLETVLSADKASGRGQRRKHRIGILGDTDGNERYIPHYVDHFADVDLLVLHLGAFSDRRLARGGKHLYIRGMHLVLESIGRAIVERRRLMRTDEGPNTTILLSEFGLELADSETLYRKLRPFLVSYSWRLPLIYSGLYERERQAATKGRPVGTIGPARFFARGTLEMLARAAQAGAPDNGPAQSISSASQLDKLIVALGFQTIAFGKGGLLKAADELTEALSVELKQDIDRERLDGWESDDYFPKLADHLRGSNAIKPLRRKYRDMVGMAAFGNASMSCERLVQGCDVLFGLACRNFENPASPIRHADNLGYVQRFAQSRKLPRSARVPGRTRRKGLEWPWNLEEQIESLGLFWMACMIGLFALREAVKSTSGVKGQALDEENTLLSVGRVFRKEVNPWASLLVGDIGCTFGLDPFSTLEEGRRQEGIWLRSNDGQWISPHDAEDYYDPVNDRISYRERA